MSRYIVILSQFILLLVFQILILDNITINWFSQNGFPVFTPYIYPLFLLLLPFETPVWLLLLVGFLLGAIIDMFSNTPGMHACAMVLIAYLRTNVLISVLPKNLKEYYTYSPTIKTMGWAPFYIYATFLILIHHIVFFTIELWSFNNLQYLLIKVACSTLTTLLLILTYTLLFSPNSKR